MGVLIYLIELITQKVKSSRKLLEGEPSIIIHKGKLKYDVLKKNKLDINQLQSLLRQANCFSIQEAEYAILETNGMVSVLPKFQYDTTKNGDMQIKPKQVSLPVTLIIDGEVLYENLKEAGLEEKQLNQELKKLNIKKRRTCCMRNGSPINRCLSCRMRRKNKKSIALGQMLFIIFRVRLF